MHGTRSASSKKLFCQLRMCTDNSLHRLWTDAYSAVEYVPKIVLIQRDLATDVLYNGQYSIGAGTGPARPAMAGPFSAEAET